MIEFIGPPGAGKTTLIDSLNKEYKEIRHWDELHFKALKKVFFSDKKTSGLPGFVEKVSSLPLYSKSLKKSSKFRSFYLNYFTRMTGISEKMIVEYNKNFPKSFRIIKKYLDLFSDDEDWKSCVLTGIIKRVNKYMIIKSRYDMKNILVDDGLLQFTGSIFVPSYPKRDFFEREVEECINNIPSPNYVVYVKTNPKKCISRMKKRSRGFPKRYEKLTQTELEKRLKKINRYFTITFQHLNSKGVKAILIDGKKEKKEMIKNFKFELLNDESI